MVSPLEKAKRTPWFPPNITPKHYGVYERKMPSGEGKYSFWSGKWGGWGATIAIAYSNADYVSSYQNLKWRGLAEKPCP